MSPTSPGFPQAFIFDMDGVIIHSTPVHNEAWRQHLMRHSIGEEIATIEAKMLGKHNDELVRIFFGDGLSQEEILRHGADKERLYRELMAPHFEEHLVAGVVDFIRRQTVPIGVATNAEPENVRFVLDRSGLRPYFRAVIDGSQVERPKPDPEVYLRMIERLGIEAARSVIFEDSIVGVAAARASGARVVGVATSSPVLDGCDLTIRDFHDPALARWLGT